jgi:hypothetical protein
LSICIVILFHWCCFFHLYCDLVSLVLFCPSVLWSCFTGVETRSQYRWTKQHQWNMITIQMDKITPVKQDHNTGVVLSICIVILFHWCCFVHLYCDHISLVLCFSAM